MRCNLYCDVAYERNTELFILCRPYWVNIGLKLNERLKLQSDSIKKFAKPKKRRPWGDTSKR